jgi:membrane protease subunit HflC
MRRFLSLSAALIVAVYFFTTFICYVVDEREQAVVLQFGRPIHARTQAGLYFKWPMIQTVVRLPKTRQLWGGEIMDELPDLPTKDGKKVEVIPWAVWRVTDPVVFVKVLINPMNAQQRVNEFTRNAVRDVITQYDLIELVRSSDRKLTYTFGTDLAGTSTPADAPEIAIEQPKEISAAIKVGRPKILSEIKQEASKRLGNEGGRGIEILDVGVARIDFVESVRRAAFERLRKFMESIAAYYTNDGERQKQAIINRSRAEVQRIEGEGKQRSNETRGKVDAEIIRRYAATIAEVGEFYAFLRSLEVVKTSIDAQTRLVLTTESGLLRVLKEMPTTEASSAGAR